MGGEIKRRGIVGDGNACVFLFQLLQSGGGGGFEKKRKTAAGTKGTILIYLRGAVKKCINKISY